MRRTASFVVLVWIALPTADALSTLAGDGEKSIREAVALYQQGTISGRGGDTERSKLYFARAVGALPGFPEAHFGLGHIALQEKRYAEALDHYERARDGFRNLGSKLYDLRVERFRDVQDEISALNDLLLELNSPRNRQRNLDRQRTQLEEKIRALRLVRLPTPGDGLEPPGEVFFYIGNAQFHLGQIANAVRSWEVCASRAPDFPLVHNNLAIGYLKLGRFDEARASLDRAERLGVAVHPELKRDIARTTQRSSLQKSR